MATKTKASAEEILSVWQDAKPIKGKDPKVWRKDEAGNIIKFSEYDTNSKYSWEIK